MDKNAAKRLVRETLQNPFNKGDFLYLIKNILNKFKEESSVSRGNAIPEDFRDSIEVLERLGIYKDANGKSVDVLIVYLKKSSLLERARTKLRNFVAKYLRGSGTDKNAALVAFVSPCNEDWRFSFVKMDYKFKKNGAEEFFTPAKRCSFLVGINENSHTAQSRLLKLLLNDDDYPMLEDLEEAFSIEQVTKEFFEIYRGLFLRVKDAIDNLISKNVRLKNEFILSNINTSDFSKKLLGQIVFLYFLQKKGWFGVEESKKWGSGSKTFLRELFNKEKIQYNNFFEDVLQPLFYKALREKRKGDYFKPFECRIPFLNGGLFDPINNYDWKNLEIPLPNELFCNEVQTKDGDIGDGILDVFDRYNFTVKEDEPLEKEVAVDPEMLGQVFENLLEVTDRKSKGTYYTPREIVHYMCQESLTNYLFEELKDTVSKDDLENFIQYGDHIVEHELRVLEKGRETETYFFILAESIRSNAKLIDKKLASIRICDPAVGSGAFPVGMMNEIIRARIALSPYLGIKRERSRSKLKREAIQNCLYGVDIDPGAVEIAKLRLWLSLVVEEKQTAKIEPLPNLDYKIVQGNSLLNIENNLFNNGQILLLERLKLEYFEETNSSKKKQLKKKIDKIIFQITNNYSEFDFRIHFSEIFRLNGGFDVVISNPPYGIVYDKKTKEKLILNYNCFRRNNDLYIAFYQLGLEILKNYGILNYISPNTFLNGDYFSNFRIMLTSSTVLKEILDFKDHRIFDDPTVFVCVLCCQKNKKISFPYKYNFKVSMDSNDEEVIHSISLNSSTENSLKISDNIYSFIINQQNVYPADNFFYIKDVGFNYWTKGRGKKRGNGSIGKRVLYSGNINDRRDVPYLKGRDIASYHITNPTNFLLHDYNNFLDSDDVFRFTPEFLKQNPKIVYRQTSSRIIAALDIKGQFIDKTVHLIVNKPSFPKLNLKYTLALLNSKLFHYLYLYISQESKGRAFAQVKVTYLKKMPMKICSINTEHIIVDLVDKIMCITNSQDYQKNTTKQDKVNQYKSQIDEIIFELYGLKQKDILLIESFCEDDSVPQNRSGGKTLFKMNA